MLQNSWLPVTLCLGHVNIIFYNYLAWLSGLLNDFPTTKTLKDYTLDPLQDINLSPTLPLGFLVLQLNLSQVFLSEDHFW